MGLARRDETNSVERLREQGALSQVKEMFARQHGWRIGVGQPPAHIARQPANVDPADVRIAHHVVEEVDAVRKKLWGPVSGLLDIQRRERCRNEARTLRAKQGTVGHERVNHHAIAVPGGAGWHRGPRNGLHETALQVDALHGAIGEEAHGAAVRVPERQLRMLGSRQRASRCRGQRAHPQARRAIVAGDEHHHADRRETTRRRSGRW